MFAAGQLGLALAIIGETPTGTDMRRLHWSTVVGAAIMGTLALVTLGPVAVAVMMLRCCGDTGTGPGAGAWIVVTLLVAALVAAAAVVGGLAARLLRWAVLRYRDRSQE